MATLAHPRGDRRVHRIDEIKGQRIRNVLTAAKPRRQIVTMALATCPPGEWIDVDILFTTMRRGNMSPTIARTDMALWKLYLVDPQYGSLGYDGFHGWELLEGRYTLAILFEYAGTLGLVDLDYVHASGARADFRGNWGSDDLGALSRYDGLQAIRLTALGAYVLGLTDTYQPTSTDPTTAQPLKVLPNLDIVATGEIPAADRLILSTYAQQTADRVWTASATSHRADHPPAGQRSARGPHRRPGPGPHRRAGKPRPAHGQRTHVPATLRSPSRGVPVVAPRPVQSGCHQPKFTPD
jgi:hypothetical protein